MPIEGLMPDSVINSQKHSLVYLAKGQTAYGPCHLVHPLTTLASIYKVRTFSPVQHAKKRKKKKKPTEFKREKCIIHPCWKFIRRCSDAVNVINICRVEQHLLYSELNPIQGKYPWKHFPESKMQSIYCTVKITNAFFQIWILFIYLLIQLISSVPYTAACKGDPQTSAEPSSITGKHLE